MDNELLTRAIVVWTGRGRNPWPERDDEAVVTAFGDELGLDLLARVRTLADDFYNSKANVEAPDISAMGKQAAAEFHAKHPEIGEDAVRALAWCYTYDFK
ncbi:hypothetical protein AB0368_07225 [Actinoplanes sp. NPDC051475]|uniref:hypothetical protein n=1 Tax=Actinoplanes sp. NPDC051475 TaxID=3157225 RepID=UPI00344B5CA8